MAKKFKKQSSDTTATFGGGQNLKFPNLIDNPTLNSQSAGTESSLLLSKKSASSKSNVDKNSEISGTDKNSNTDLATKDDTKTSEFDSDKFYFINKKEKIFSAIASVLLFLFAILLSVSAQFYKPTKSDIKTYGKNVKSVLTTAAYEHAVLWAVIAIFLFVATFWIKRRAPIIVGAVLAAFALGLITPYGLIYIALAAVVGYNAYKIKQNTPKEARPIRTKSTGGMFKKNRPVGDKATTDIVKKAAPKQSSRYTPPKHIPTKPSANKK